VEYVLSKKDNYPCLYGLDFGMASLWTTENELKNACNDLQYDMAIPDKSNLYFNPFVVGFLMFVKQHPEKSRFYADIVLSELFKITPEESITILQNTHFHPLQQLKYKCISTRLKKSKSLPLRQNRISNQNKKKSYSDKR
jgi:hypothetical protein